MGTVLCTSEPLPANHVRFTAFSRPLFPENKFSSIRFSYPRSLAYTATAFKGRGNVGDGDEHRKTYATTGFHARESSTNLQKGTTGVLHIPTLTRDSTGHRSPNFFLLNLPLFYNRT